MGEKIEVTREEYEAEVARLRELTERYSRKWPRLRQLVRNVSRWETRVADLTRSLNELKRRLPASWREYRYIRDVEIPWARERLAYWTSQREAYIAEMRTELNEILTERERIARKIVKPPPPIYIGTEGKTGYDIYYNPKTKKYEVIDPTTREKVREEHKIVVEYTASIETGVRGKTGSFEFIDVEVTAITGVKEADDSELKRIEDEMDRTVLEYLANPWVEGGGWGAALAVFEKKGIDYNGLSIIEEQDHYGYPVPQYPTMAIHVEKTTKSTRPKDYGWHEYPIR